MIFDRVYNNGSLHIWYNGQAKTPNEDTTKKFEQLEKVFNNKSFSNDLLRIILYVRTILKDYEEFLLVIKTSEDDVVVNVRYINGKFTEYTRTELLDIAATEDKITFTYSADGISKITFSNNCRVDQKYKLIRRVQELVSDGLEFVSKLEKEITPRKLNSADKFLVYMFETFYETKIDFTDEDVEIKMQSMLYLMHEFNIPIQIGEQFVNFYIYDEYPESCLISNWVKDLMVLDEQEGNNVSEIPYFIHYVVSEFGQIIRNNFPKEKFEETFSRFCTAIFVKSYLCNVNSKEKEIANRIREESLGEYSEDELKNYFNVKKILDEKYKNAQKNYL